AGGLRQEPAAALLRQPLDPGDPRGRRGARRRLPPRIRRARAHRQRGAPRPSLNISPSFPRKRESRAKDWVPATGTPRRERRGVPLAGTNGEADALSLYSSICSGRRTVCPEAAARSMAIVVSRLMRACSGVVWIVGAPVAR